MNFEKRRIGLVSSFYLKNGESVYGELKMNKDQFNGTAKDIAGKVQQAAGKMTGNKEQQIKGAGKQIEGKMQETRGDLKQAVNSVTAKK
ncbi:CsbD family protein [Undibacterium sp. SXout20W]|uniref:CsbD family protein n=1 Tax=Undibacterium sp. SXout20W TaxID=3413051 RepID=UPI003BF4C494